MTLPTTRELMGLEGHQPGQPPLPRPKDGYQFRHQLNDVYWYGWFCGITGTSPEIRFLEKLGKRNEIMPYVDQLRMGQRHARETLNPKEAIRNSYENWPE